MRRAWLSIVLACLCGAAAWADIVHMKDGRKLHGKVSHADGRIKIKMRYGTAYLDKDQIERIEMEADPERDYKTQAAKIAQDDAEGHYKLGLWCETQKLPDRAQHEFKAAMAADPNHDGARKQLGYVKVRGRWTTCADLVRSAQALLKLGRLDRCIATLEPLAALPTEDAAKKEALLLLASVYERKGEWAKAIAQYDALERLPLTASQKVQAQARREIITKHPDGMYMVAEAAGVEPGMHPLTDPKVMAAAVHDKAKEHLERGKAAYEKARKVDVADPKKAVDIFLEADGHFDKANALSPDIARAFKVEVARKLIAVHERDFGQSLAKLVGTPMPTMYYYKGSGKFTAKSREKWQAYVHTLERYCRSAEKNLQQMLDLAQPYPDELSELISMAKKCAKDLEKQRAFLRQQRKRENIGR